MKDEKKLLALLGIAKKAGKVVSGTDMVVESIRSQKKNSVKLLILSSDASANTTKRINNTSAYYNIPLMVTEADKNELAHITGHSSALSVVGIIDSGFAEAMLKTTEN